MYFYLHKYWPGLRFSEMICKRGTTVSLTVEQDTLQNELKDTWPSELIPHICFISLYPSQIPSNWFWIVIFILNKLPLLIVKVHCATQFSYRANDRKGAGGGGRKKKPQANKKPQTVKTTFALWSEGMRGYTRQPNARVVSCTTYPSTLGTLSPVYSILYRCIRRDSPCPVEEIKSVEFL